jgi:hypothetical protein
MLERRYRITKDDIDHLAWLQQLKTMHDFHEDKRNNYWCTTIADNRGNMWRLCRRLHESQGNP